MDSRLAGRKEGGRTGEDSETNEEGREEIIAHLVL